MACEYCKGGHQLYQTNIYTKLYMNHFGLQRTLEIESRICPPYVDCCMKDIPVRSVFIINYCPNCGEKLGDELA